MHRLTSEYREKKHPDIEVSVPQFAATLKRDLFIAVGLFFGFIILDRLIEVRFLTFLPYLTILGIFVISYLRIFRFARSSNIGICPDCNGILEHAQSPSGGRDIVCHRCRTRFLRYRSSDNPDRIFEIESDPDFQHTTEVDEHKSEQIAAADRL